VRFCVLAALFGRTNFGPRFVFRFQFGQFAEENRCKGQHNLIHHPPALIRSIFLIRFGYFHECERILPNLPLQYNITQFEMKIVYFVVVVIFDHEVLLIG